MCQLQFRQKWNDKQQNFEVGDVVLLKQGSERNEWPMAIIEEVMPDYNGIVRSVKLRKSNFGKTSTYLFIFARKFFLY